MDRVSKIRILDQIGSSAAPPPFGAAERLNHGASDLIRPNPSLSISKYSQGVQK